MKKTKLCKHIKRTMALLLSLAMMWHAGSVLCVSASAECIEKNQENGNLEPGEDQEPPALEEEETKENGSLEPGEDQESSDLEEEEIKEDGNLESGEDRENCVSGEDDAKGSVILEEEEDQESQPLENEETTDEGEVSEKEEILFEENIPEAETEIPKEGERGKEQADSMEENKADLLIKTLSGETAAKAGSTLLYEIQIENTGGILLENLQLESMRTEDGLSGFWSREESPEKQEEEVKLAFLEPGQKKNFYLKIPLPEERTEKVNTSLRVRAEYSDTETELKKEIYRTAALETDVIPLKADFQVTKTADRSMAAPGEKIMYQICIRNTGERTLHSIVTTENFQMENISAEFLEKEGVQFNQSRTQAMIPKIAPGEAVRLQAAVKLPETLVSQELINEVTVITAETGEKEAVSQARVQVFGNSPDRENHQETDAKGTGTESRPASSVPKTGDETEGLLWLYLSVLSAAAVFSLSGRLRKKGLWDLREKMEKRKD